MRRPEIARAITSCWISLVPSKIVSGFEASRLATQKPCKQPHVGIKKGNPCDNLSQKTAEWNPVSTLTHAVRVRIGNMPAETPDPTAWPLQNAMLYSLIWAVVLIVVFAPIATRLYQRAGAR